MLKIEKKETEFGYWFQITTNEGSFEIFFAGNLDLYWRYLPTQNILAIHDDKSFMITKENYYLFSLVDELYDCIKNMEVFSLECYYDMNLLREDKVEWCNDDFDYEEASKLIIEKRNDCYKITFSKSKNKRFPTYSVRIRNSGSRYDPYNVLFMNMYHKLCDYDPDYHQIHIEEYLFYKKLLKKKETI